MDQFKESLEEKRLMKKVLVRIQRTYEERELLLRRHLTQNDIDQLICEHEPHTVREQSSCCLWAYVECIFCAALLPCRSISYQTTIVALLTRISDRLGLNICLLRSLSLLYHYLETSNLYSMGGRNSLFNVVVYEVTLFLLF